MRRQLGILALCLTLFQEVSAIPTPEESLALNRIVSFWEEESFDLAQKQILSFLTKYPSSEMRDNLFAMLGDLYFQNGQIDVAIEAYSKIQKSEFQIKTYPNLIQCYHEQKNYPIVIQKSEEFLEWDIADELEPKIHYMVGDAYFNSKQYQKAIEHYTALKGTAFENTVLWPFAKSYEMIEWYSHAADLYTSLSFKIPQRSEELLFHTACLQSRYDSNQAIETFKTVSSMNGRMAKESTFNQLILLWENRRFNDFVEAFEKNSSVLPVVVKSELQIYFGRSLMELGQYEKAVAPLETFLHTEQLSLSDSKISLLLLLSCADKTGDFDLHQRTLTEFSTRFPQDEDRLKAELLFNRLCLEKGDSQVTKQSFQRILKDFPEFDQKEQVHYGYALFLLEQQDWAAAQDILVSFIESFPKSELVSSAWKHSINASIEEVRYAAPEQLASIKEKQLMLFKSAVEQTHLFNQQEMQEMLVYLAKQAEILGKVDLAIDSATSILAYEPTSLDAHLILAMGYKKKGLNEFFVGHANKVLSINPDHPAARAIERELYNYYLEKGDLSLAAGLLFKMRRDGVKKENLVWLGHHFYNERRQDPLAAEKAKEIFSIVCQPEISPINEREALLLAELSSPEEKVQLLEQVASAIDRGTDQNWKYRDYAFFELAKTHESIGNVGKAIPAYERLIDPSSTKISYFSCAALLQKARLQYSLLSEEEKKQSTELDSILSSLKDLQYIKHLAFEPLAIEAALDYADIRIAMTPQEEQLNLELMLLKRINEEFSSDSNVLAADRFPDKEQQLKQYLRFVEAEIYRLEGKNEEAEKRLSQLLTEDLTPYLTARAQNCLRSMNDEQKL